MMSAVRTGELLAKPKEVPARNCNWELLRLSCTYNLLDLVRIFRSASSLRERATRPQLCLLTWLGSVIVGQQLDCVLMIHASAA